MANEKQTTGGISFLGLLTILFIGLKLGGIIKWSWWLVLAPIWAPIVIAIVIIVLYLGILIIKI